MDLGYGTSIEILTDRNLTGHGDHEIIFELDLSLNPACVLIKSPPLKYFLQPEFIVSPSTKATGRDSFDG